VGGFAFRVSNLVVPAFLDVMSGGNIGKTIVDIAG
jgi:hypothetical protein